MSEAKYNTHMKTFDLGVGKEWHRKAARLALQVGTVLHQHLAHLHFRDSGGKSSEWGKFSSEAKKNT